MSGDLEVRAKLFVKMLLRVSVKVHVKVLVLMLLKVFLKWLVSKTHLILDQSTLKASAVESFSWPMFVLFAGGG